MTTIVQFRTDRTGVLSVCSFSALKAVIFSTSERYQGFLWANTLSLLLCFFPPRIKQYVKYWAVNGIKQSLPGPLLCHPWTATHSAVLHTSLKRQSLHINWPLGPHYHSDSCHTSTLNHNVLTSKSVKPLNHSKGHLTYMYTGKMWKYKTLSALREH